MRHPTAPLAPRIERANLSGGPVEIGNEPPLDPGGEATGVNRHDVSIRWLGASVLTGLTGAALIGAAIYAAVQGEATFAEPPEKAGTLVRSPASDEQRSATAVRKGDKLVLSQIIASAKNSFRAPVTLRVGDREVIKVRSFVKLATSLSLTTGIHATDIPRFNPLRLFAEDSGERSLDPIPEFSEAEASVVKRDLTGVPIEPSSPALSDDDASAQIEEERRLATEAGRRSVVPIPAQLMLSRTLRQPNAFADALGYARAIDAPFNSIEIRVVPENVTTLGKIEPRPADGPVGERDIPVRRGESVESVLRSQNATADQIRSIISALGARGRGGALPDSPQLRILVAPGPRPGDGPQIVRAILFGERGVESIAAMNDRGVFVSVAPPNEDTSQRASRPREDEEDSGEEGGVRLYESLYETALKHDLPRQTIEDLVRIFGYDIDFQRRVLPGDTFDLFYALDEETGSDRPEILSAALSVGGETRRVYRYQGEDGAVEYFDELGRSLKKFLMRKPIAEGELRSGFGYRRHPVLGYTKMHTGVDWSNRIGTPIMAAGNGTVIKAEWDSGYGRRVELQHANGYVTSYNHMSRFGRGVAPGARVRQGQVVGYVGSTGLSTGPHLHYEVIVNGHFVDPMKIRVPRGRELEGRTLTEFKRQREQVEALIQRANGSTRVAQGEAR